jgi:hypothetical protein
MKAMKLAIEYWPGLKCWVIVNNAARPSDEDDLYYRLYAHGFVSEHDAKTWLTLFALAHAAGAKLRRRDFTPNW